MVSHLNLVLVVFMEKSWKKSWEKEGLEQKTQHYLWDIQKPGKRGSENMREGLGNVYTGKGWEEDIKVPEFEKQGYQENKIMLHTYKE